MRTIAVLFALITVSAIGLSQQDTTSWKGYLADQMCAFRWRGALAEKYAERHATSCNFDKECMASGYGIMVDGTFIKLTEASNPKAIAALQATKTKKGVFVEVTGTMVDGKIEAARVDEMEKRVGSRE